MVKSIFKIDFFLIKYYTLLSGDDMEKLLLIKYGELSTKKDNINFFIKTLKDNIDVSLKNIDANITYDKNLKHLKLKLKEAIKIIHLIRWRYLEYLEGLY